jgi:hypothetical protein
MPTILDALRAHAAREARKRDRESRKALRKERRAKRRQRVIKALTWLLEAADVDVLVSMYALIILAVIGTVCLVAYTVLN